MRGIVLLWVLCSACVREDGCDSSFVPVADDEDVSGVTVDALRGWLAQEHEPIPLVWIDGRKTTLETRMVVADEGALRVARPACRATCRGPGEPAPAECGQDRLTSRMAALLATRDGALAGEPMVGRAWVEGHQWRADLGPATGASLAGDLDVFELVDLDPDTFQMELRATLVGRRHRVEQAEIRLHTLHDVSTGVEERSARLAISP